MEAKAIKKPLQKNIKKMMPKMKPNWSQRDPQMASPGDPLPLRTPPGSQQGALRKAQPAELYHTLKRDSKKYSKKMKKKSSKMVPQKGPKWSPEGTPTVSQKIQNGFQKPSQNRVPKKHRKMMIFSTLKCG